MIVGLDASNLRGGGGLTHLRSLLAAADPPAAGIDRIVVWSNPASLATLPSRNWLATRSPPDLAGNRARRVAWQQLQLGPAAVEEGCAVIFSPGGTIPVRTELPAVVMFRNSLPFDAREAARYPAWSGVRARLALMRRAQERSMRKAAGVIFLTEHARSMVASRVTLRRSAVIPHGIADRFRRQPPPARPVAAYSERSPFRFLYVSPIDAYKHQWHVAEAVAELRASGLPVALDLVGSARHAPSLARTEAAIDAAGGGEHVRYLGPIDFADLHCAYHRADGFVFASSCENLPNTLLEAMAAGLPIASSDRAPMPDVLGDCGLYFDPEDPASIGGALAELLADAPRRAALGRCAARAAGTYSWERCARETLAFVAACAGPESRPPAGG